MKILFIGDIFGNLGRKAAKDMISEIKREEKFDFCIANAENAVGGSGITYLVAQELYKAGIDGITLGNHTWSKREVMNFIDTDPKIIRPANFHKELPGKGSRIISSPAGKIGILNLVGRIYMDSADCPFRTADQEIEYLKTQVKIIIVDMHAEATSEKSALAWYLDGRVSAVLGTHTHVQTSDERILPCGTGFITDVGMTGPHEGIIGVNRDIVIEKFIKNLPARFEAAQGMSQFNAVLLDIDEKTGRCTSIVRKQKVM